MRSPTSSTLVRCSKLLRYFEHRGAAVAADMLVASQLSTSAAIQYGFCQALLASATSDQLQTLDVIAVLEKRKLHLTLHKYMCNVVSIRGMKMATNLNIDTTLLQEAYRIGKFKSKRETVNIALKEYIQRKKQKNIIKYFNSIDLDSSFDYKAARK